MLRARARDRLVPISGRAPGSGGSRPRRQLSNEPWTSYCPTGSKFLDNEVLETKAELRETVAKLGQNRNDRILQAERDRLERRLVSLDAARQDLVLQGWYWVGHARRLLRPAARRSFRQTAQRVPLPRMGLHPSILGPPMPHNLQFWRLLKSKWAPAVLVGWMAPRGSACACCSSAGVKGLRLPRVQACWRECASLDV